MNAASWAIVIAALFVLKSYLHQAIIKRRFRNQFQVKSTSTNLPIFGDVLQILLTGGVKGAIQRGQKNHEKYGETFISFIFDDPTFDVADAEALKIILSPKFSIYDRNFTEQTRLGDLLGGGLILESNGEKWRKTRQILMNGFHQTRLAETMETIGMKTQRFVNEVKENSRFDIQESFGNLTFNLACFFSLGVDMDVSETSFEGKSMNQVWYEVLDHTQSRFLAPFNYWEYFQTPGVKKFNRQLNFLKGLVMRAIEVEKNSREGAQPKAQKSLLSFMVAEHMRDPESLSLDDIVRNSITFLFAGHDTTTNLLVFMFYHIGLDEEIKAKCLEEVDSMFNGKPLDYIPNINELKQLRYLKMVAKETLRIYPGAPLRGRTLQEEDDLLGTKLPAKMWLTLDLHATHMNPKYWPEPERFDPERFTEELEAQRPAHYWLPFGLGPRRCIGEQLALLKALCVTTMVLRRFDPFSDPKQVIEKEMTLTMKAKDGIWMDWRKRV